MSFAQFPEHQQSIDLLRRSLNRGRVAHSYLFVGIVPDELEAVARTLAKTLNCQDPLAHGSTGIPLESCGKCSSCRRIENESHVDVQWIRPESKTRVITIDQMRDLMQTINLKPSEAAYKVAIITAADRLNTQAANAFLKTLEEPPARSVIILLTTEPQRILETVLSRCLRLSFAGNFNFAAGQNADLVAGFSRMTAGNQHGLLGRYRLLGMLLTRLSEIKSETEKVITRRSPLEEHDELDPRLRDKWEIELAAAIEAEYRRKRSEVLLGLQWWLRDVWLQTLSLGKGFLVFPNLAEVSEQVAARISIGEGSKNLEVMENLQRLLTTNVQEALALEVCVLKLRL